MLRIARSLPWSKSTGSSRRIRSAVDQVSSLTRRHTAKAAIPSSRPIGPNFSLVVALMPIWLGATSRTWDKEFLIDWICGAILGLLGKNREVNVSNRIPVRLGFFFDRLFQYSNGVHVLVLRTVVGEIVSDAESECPEHCIGKCGSGSRHPNARAILVHGEFQLRQGLACVRSSTGEGHSHDLFEKGGHSCLQEVFDIGKITFRLSWGLGNPDQERSAFVPLTRWPKVRP